MGRFRVGAGFFEAVRVSGAWMASCSGSGRSRLDSRGCGAFLGGMLMLGRARLWLVCAATLVAVVALAPTQASASLVWSRSAAPLPRQRSDLSSVSCASSSLCVALSIWGDVIVSARPFSDAPSWSVRAVKPTSPAISIFNAISCVPGSLCVAVDGSSGDLVASADPTGGAGSWTLTNLDSQVGNIFGLTGVSCASLTFCVATEVSGSDPAAGVDYAFISTNPTGGAASWTRTLMTATGGAVVGVSCPSVSFCAAVDARGDVLTSTDPARDPGPWTATNVDHNNFGLLSISCSSARWCAAVDNFGDVVTSTDPTGGAVAWHSAKISNDRLGSVSCASSSLCVAADYWKGEVAVSTHPTGESGAWHVSDIAGSVGLTGVSCPSPSMCVAVDGDGNLFVGKDSRLLRPSDEQIMAQLSNDIVPKGKGPPIGGLVKSRRYALAVTALTPGNAAIAWYYAPTRARGASHLSRRTLIAKGTKRFVRARTAKITIMLTANGERLLSHARYLRLIARGTFAPTGRTAIVTTRAFTLRR